MNNKEISEIRKLFTIEKCCIDRIGGCYVNADKEIVMTSKSAFLSLPEEEMYKYFEIFRKALSENSGRKRGKNLFQLEFPNEAEYKGAAQDFLLQIRDSSLKDDDLLAQFYDKIIGTYHYSEPYYIILINGHYDIPMRRKDKKQLDDSEYVYSYMLCCICPVKLSEAALSYHKEDNSIHERNRDRVVIMPETAFLFPAFTDRNTDIHSLLYYTKNDSNINASFIEDFLNCTVPVVSDIQRKNFSSMLENTWGDNCCYDNVAEVYGELRDMQEESGPNVVLDKNDIRKIIEKCGASESEMESYSESFDVLFGERGTLMPDVVANKKKVTIKTAYADISVNAEDSHLVEVKKIDGRKSIVIAVEGTVTFNGTEIK